MEKSHQNNLEEKQIYQLVHKLYFKAGLLKHNNDHIYDLKVHSIRKYFKTQMIALSVQSKNYATYTPTQA